MTLTEQVKILDDRIKTNKAQYDLDREAAKISALSSGELEKYEYLKSTHYLIMKIRSKRELQQITINHSADIDYKDVLKIYRNCINEPYSFFTIGTTLPTNNPMRFRKNFSDAPL